jgi:hypothetical protein
MHLIFADSYILEQVKMAWFVIDWAITFNARLDTTYWGVYKEGKTLKFLQKAKAACKQILL